MTNAQILDWLAGQGITLTLEEGDKIRVDAKTPPSVRIIERLRANKAGLIEELRLRECRALSSMACDAWVKLVDVTEETEEAALLWDRIGDAYALLDGAALIALTTEIEKACASASTTPTQTQQPSLFALPMTARPSALAL